MLSTTLAPIHHHIINNVGHIQQSTKTQYIRAIDRLLETGIDPRDRDMLAEYAQELPQSSRAFLKAALRILFKEQVNFLKASATADNIGEKQAKLLNIEAMLDTIQIHKKKGQRAHTWLTPDQIMQITALPDTTTPSGRRDWLTLALMASAGLRREEVVTVTFDRLKLVPNNKNELCHILNVTGKGAKDRSLQIAPLLADRIKEWHTEAGDGLILRSVDRTGRVNHSLTGKSIYEIVKRYGTLLGLPELRPHDLRRSYAMILYNDTKDLTLVMTRLGHSSPTTTKDYLDLELQLDKDTSTIVPLSGD
jgi:integrase